MLLSKGCVYGVRAALYVACRGQDRFVPIREISSELDISFHFLTKVLQMLTEKGIMTSARGPRGGVALARPPAEIKLMDIIGAIDGHKLLQECMLGMSGCGCREPCPLHLQWCDARQVLSGIFERNSLEHLAGLVAGEPATPLFYVQ